MQSAFVCTAQQQHERFHERFHEEHLVKDGLPIVHSKHPLSLMCTTGLVGSTNRQHSNSIHHQFIPLPPPAPLCCLSAMGTLTLHPIIMPLPPTLLPLSAPPFFVLLHPLSIHSLPLPLILIPFLPALPPSPMRSCPHSHPPAPTLTAPTLTLLPPFSLPHTHKPHR